MIGQLSEGHLQVITVNNEIGDAVLVQDRVLEMFKPLKEEGREDPDICFSFEPIPSR